MGHATSDSRTIASSAAQFDYASLDETAEHKVRQRTRAIRQRVDRRSMVGTVRDVVQYNSGTNTTTIVDHLKYDSFGNITAQSNSADQPLFAYTGQMWDAATGLYYYHARWYDPHDGRFISQDPMAFGAGDMNLYRYVGNGPTNATDPTGTDEQTAGGAGSGGGQAAAASEDGEGEETPPPDGPNLTDAEIRQWLHEPPPLPGIMDGADAWKQYYDEMNRWWKANVDAAFGPNGPFGEPPIGGPFDPPPAGSGFGPQSPGGRSQPGDTPLFGGAGGFLTDGGEIPGGAPGGMTGGAPAGGPPGGPPSGNHSGSTGGLPDADDSWLVVDNKLDPNGKAWGQEANIYIRLGDFTDCGLPPLLPPDSQLWIFGEWGLPRTDGFIGGGLSWQFGPKQ